ncbi:MAG: FkbM family methyltransferase [Thermodesulfobacteriota bacterium]
MFGLLLAKIFARIYWCCKKITKRNLPGLGRALDLIKGEHVLDVEGKKVFFDPRIGRAYGLMIIGQWNEPETHIFLRNVLDKIDGSINFVDVGASIGEFVLDMASHEKAAKVIAFEPQPEAASAIGRSFAINGFQKGHIIQKIVTDDLKDLYLLLDQCSPTASHVVSSISEALKSNQRLMKIPVTTLDEELSEIEGSTIILLDIEGGEYLAIKGALRFIRRWRPLLIFEYNSVSRKSFDLNMVRGLLGSDYSIYRLSSDGHIDSNETQTWNMVAVSKSSNFYTVVSSLYDEICLAK